MPLKRSADDEDHQDTPGVSAKRILSEDPVRPQLSRGDSLPTGNFLHFLQHIDSEWRAIINLRLY